jgi:flagellar hook-length control protein FliK
MMTPAIFSALLPITGQTNGVPTRQESGGDTDRDSATEDTFDVDFSAVTDETTQADAARPAEKSAKGRSETDSEPAARPVDAEFAASLQVDPDMSSDITFPVTGGPVPVDSWAGSTGGATSGPASPEAGEAGVGGSPSSRNVAEDPTPIMPVAEVARGDLEAPEASQSTRGSAPAARAASLSIDTPGGSDHRRLEQTAKLEMAPPAPGLRATGPQQIAGSAAADVSVSVTVSPPAGEAAPRTPEGSAEGTTGPALTGRAHPTSGSPSAASPSVSVSVQPRAEKSDAPAPDGPDEAGTAPAPAERAKPAANSPALPYQVAHPSAAADVRATVSTPAGAPDAGAPAPELPEVASANLDPIPRADQAGIARVAGLRSFPVAMSTVAAQVQDQVQVLADGRRISIRLDPPDLGSFEVRLEMSGNAVQAVVASERTDTLELLARYRSELIAILQDAEFDVLDARFESGGESAPSEYEDETVLSHDGPANTEETVESQPGRAPNSWLEAGARLDIRV